MSRKGDRDLSAEAHEALLRPLFTTSFLIADWLAHEQHFGADTVIISSASSKTAYGTAYALTRDAGDDRPEVVGLTSPAHVASTERLGLYDRVLSYDDIATLDPERASVYVDLSGSAEIRGAVHRRCAGLRHDCAVGLTHWGDTDTDTDTDTGTDTGAVKPLPGPKPVFFFAPAELERQAAQTGRAEVFGRIGSAMEGFVARVSDPSAPLMDITWQRGGDAASQAYLDVALGRTDPGDAFMVAM